MLGKGFSPLTLTLLPGTYSVDGQGVYQLVAPMPIILTLNSGDVKTVNVKYTPEGTNPTPTPVYYPYGLPASVTISMMDGSTEIGTLLTFTQAQAINYNDNVALWALPIPGNVNPAVPVPEVPSYNVWDWDRTNKFFGSANPSNLNAPLVYPAGSV